MTSSKPLLLVTGGSGYIGSALVKQAIAAGYRLHVLDGMDLPQDDVISQAQKIGQVRLFKGSITDSIIVRQSLQGVQLVVHLAGISDGRAGKADPALTKRVNVETIESVLNGAVQVGVKRFLFASTMGVYGNCYAGLLSEDLPPNPVDPYSESKVIGEARVLAADSDNFRTIALRIAMVYGAGVRIREDFLVNNLCRQAVLNGKLTITGGGQRRPQIHINDLNSLILHLLEPEHEAGYGRAINAVESNPSVSEIAAVIQNILPSVSVEVTQTDQAMDTFEMDNERLKNLVGFIPEYDMHSGVAQTIDYFKNN